MTEWAHTQSLIIHIDLYSSYVFTFIKNGDRGVQSDPIIGLHLQKEFRGRGAEQQHPVSSYVVKQSILGLNLIQLFHSAASWASRVIRFCPEQPQWKEVCYQELLLPAPWILETELRPHPHEQQDRGARSRKPALRTSSGPPTPTCFWEKKKFGLWLTTQVYFWITSPCPVLVSRRNLLTVTRDPGWSIPSQSALPPWLRRQRGVVNCTLLKLSSEKQHIHHFSSSARHTYLILEGTEVPAYCVPQREKNQSMWTVPMTTVFRELSLPLLFGVFSYVQLFWIPTDMGMITSIREIVAEDPLVLCRVCRVIFSPVVFWEKHLLLPSHLQSSWLVKI